MFGCVPNLEQTLPEIDLNANYFLRSARTSVPWVEGIPFGFGIIKLAKPGKWSGFLLFKTGPQVRSPDLALLF
jgi:hypothetical protein